MGRTQGPPKYIPASPALAIEAIAVAQDEDCKTLKGLIKDDERNPSCEYRVKS